MSRSPGGTTALWVAFAVVAVASGWIAVQMVGNAVTPASIPVLTAGEVSERLATAQPAPTPRPAKAGTTTSKPDDKPDDKPGDPEPQKTSTKPGEQQTSTPKPTPTQTAAPPPDTVVRTIASRGGSVVAACRAGSVTLRTWSPAVGYRIDDVDRGPDSEVEVTFISSSTEVQLKVRCVSGVPTGQSEVDDESGDDD